MAINAALNFVFPIRNSEDGTPLIWAYHTPMTSDVFRANYRVIAATKDALFRKGLKTAAEVGLPIADLALLDAASADAAEYGTQDTGQALLNEFKRSTLVLCPGENGFDVLPVDAAIARGTIDADDWHDGECVIVFFTCLYQVSMRKRQSTLGEAFSSVVGGSMTSLPPLEWANSLKPSTLAEPSLAPVEPTGIAPSSLPFSITQVG